MKNFLTLIAAVAVVGLAATSCGGSSTPRSEEDSVAYAIGTLWGSQLKSLDSTLNLNAFSAGVKDAFKGDVKMDQQAASEFLNEYFGVRKPAKAKEASEKFLADLEKKNKNIQKTESGLLYEIIEAGSDVKALNSYDTVKVIYTGTLKEGKQFDSSKKEGTDSTFTTLLNRVIPGWTEGMKLVGEGGKVKLYIPSDLAYGEYGQGPIGPNEALVFEVEMLKVMPGQDPAATQEVKK